jgi:hypothetical protein
MDSKKYFFLARIEEQLNCDAAALLLYLSSFCSSLEEGPASLAGGTINKNNAPTEEALALPFVSFYR